MNTLIKKTLQLAAGKRHLRFMEVCGTHTVSIFRSGIRQILPDNVELVSGP
ncbi:MAG: hydrogenase formation protein HypD, partial [Selenomonadaceae bacterium]|nr:hydrogenase formation protein HypD [Selenomonadaceae bacterium]